MMEFLKFHHFFNIFYNKIIIINYIFVAYSLDMG